MNVLGWSDWHIMSVTERGHEYLIEAERSIVPAVCIYCDSDQVYRHGRKRQLYLDTPVHGKHSVILVHRRRFLCQSCHRSIFEPLPQMSPTHFMTLRLVDYIEQQALRQTFVSVAQLVGVTEGTVRQVFAAYQKQQQQEIILVAPSQIGIDEVKIDGSMRAVIVDMEHHRILDILLDRKKSSVLNFLLQLPERDRVEWATIDMWKSYLDVIHQALPQARVAVDKFHVVRLANRGLEAVRKRIRRSLSDKQRKTLMHDKYILLHRRADLSESQLLILEAWILNLPELGTAYELKESYCDLWEADTRSEAMALYQTWRERVPAHLEDDFKPLLTAMSNWHTEIFAHFDCGLTNAYTETLNGIIKRLIHQSRGASFEVIRAKIRLHGGLHLPLQPVCAERQKKRKRK